MVGVGGAYLSSLWNGFSGACSSLVNSVKSFAGLSSNSAKSNRTALVNLHDDLDKPRDKCGVFAYFSRDHKTDLGNQLYKGLIGIQHRGQKNCGLAFTDGKTLVTKLGPQKENATASVNEVFKKDDVKAINGNFGIAHTLYSTTGSTVQPITIGENSQQISFVHNGNLSDLQPLKDFLDANDISYNDKESDSSMMAKAIQIYVSEGDDLELAVHQAARFFIGSFSLIAMNKEKLVILRDPFGNRPLSLAKVARADGKGDDFIVCSETAPFDSLKASFIRDVAPGELLVIDKNTTEQSLKEKKPKLIFSKTREGLCPIEYIYFAKPNSEIHYTNGKANAEVKSKSFSELRREFGKFTAAEFRKKFPNKNIDFVVPVPESGIPAATGFAEELKVPINPALIKNFHRRTFIDFNNQQAVEPNEDEAFRQEVENKFAVIKDAIKDKVIALVDDSVIRGRTVRAIINLLKESRPKEIHVISASPQVHYPNHYGIDLKGQSELIASQHNGKSKNIAKDLEVDSITFLELDNFKVAIRKTIGEEKEKFDKSIYSGNYKLENYIRENYIPPKAAA